MRHYLIKNSNEVYSILENGIKDEVIVYSIDEVKDAFIKALSDYIPLVFEINTEIKRFSNFKMANNINPNNIKVVNLKDININESLPNFIYEMYKANNKYVYDNICKISEKLQSSGNDDLANYLNLAIKISFENNNQVKRFANLLNNKNNSYERIMKLAGAIDLGNPDLAGKSLADIVAFLLKRIPENKRRKATISMVSKIRALSPAEISSKNMGDYSSMGQSLTFLKNVLAGHNEGYVRRVLDSIVRNL